MIKYQVAGIVVSNLVKKRDYSTFDPQEIAQAPKGNFSGKPVEPISNQLIAKIYQEFAGKIIIIGVGGVFEPEDAYRKIKLGANLVQLITGMVYLGPATIWKINQGLAQLLRQDGYTNITEAVGAEHKKSYSK
jgi:dihydroorotate dehydrogenase